MRVNSTPNFKALFAEDSETRKCLMNIGHSQGYFPVKVAQKAMKDIPVRDTVSLSNRKGYYVASNEAKKTQIYLGRDEKSALKQLINVIFDKSFGLFGSDRIPAKSKEVYINDLKEFIKKNPDKIVFGEEFFE